MVFENQLFHKIKVSKIELTIKFHQMIFSIILRSGKADLNLLEMKPGMTELF